MDAGLDDLDKPVVIFHVFAGPRFHELQMRTHPAGVADEGAGLYAEALGLVTRGDAARVVRKHRHDRDRLASQFRPLLLFNGREEGVEVDEERAEHGGTITGIGGEENWRGGVAA